MFSVYEVTVAAGLRSQCQMVGLWSFHLQLPSTIVAFVQLLSYVQLFAIPWTVACYASLSFTVSWSLLNFMSIDSVMLSDHLILYHPLLLCLQTFPASESSSESALLIRWTKYWSFNFSISPSSEYPGLISFRTDWFDLLTVQGTLKSLLQHHNSEASIPRRSAFLVVQLLHLYMTTEKAHSFNYMGLCWQSDVSAFSYAI